MDFFNYMFYNCNKYIRKSEEKRKNQLKKQYSISFAINKKIMVKQCE